jgi:hypothetical protein
MSQKNDWFPGSRDDQLTMARNWIAIMTAKASDWGLPPGLAADLTTLADTAETALSRAKNEATRTPVVTARCREAFGRLEEEMRDIKKRHFYISPLAEADFVALGLKVPGSTKTGSGTPTAQVTAETYLVGRHELGIRIVYVTGDPGDKANKGYRIWYNVIAQDETPPANPGELRKSFFTKRKKDVMEFDYGDSGKTVWLAIQVENDGKKRTWGPLVSALIP